MVPKPLVALCVTVYVPAAAYVTTGFCAVELAGAPPGNVQFQDVGELEERSVKFTLCPAHIEVGYPEKLTTGEAHVLTVI